MLGVPDPTSVVFTSGATESNNWAILGTTDAAGTPGHLIASSIEHPSVSEPLHRLKARGWRVSFLRVGDLGVVDPDDLARELRDDTVLVSIMAANNETGAIQPIRALSTLVKERHPSAVFHTDATQATGKIPVSLAQDYKHVDLLSLSAHKFHGPKGVGALFVREGTTLAPFIVGGGQENGRRSGTTNVPGVVGVGVAAALAAEGLCGVNSISHLRDRFETGLRDRLPEAIVHATLAPRLPNTSCFSLPGCSANSLADVLATKGIFVGTGSACSFGSFRPPKTLTAMGIGYDIAVTALRVGLSRYTREEEIEALLDAIVACRNGSTS